MATFKKTVAMHETFLTRLAAHPVFRHDHNFRVFLEYEQDVSLALKPCQWHDYLTVLVPGGRSSFELCE